MELLRFATAGSVDDGKSTLIGRLLYDSKAIFEDQLEAVERVSVQRGNDYTDLALLTDGLRAEREQGITIDVAYRYFATPARKFIIADTPGHVQYTRNMVTGNSTADLTMVLIDARKGIVEQTRRHAFLASLLRVPHLLVCINKMDLVDYDQTVFEQICAEFTAFASRLDITDVTFIPISALVGDNVVTRSATMDWYQGTSLLHHLETVYIASDRNLIDPRMPVQWVIRPHAAEYHDYRGYAGRIDGGVFRAGDEVLILPSGLTTTVASIDTFEGPVEEAFAPMSVTMRLADNIDISRGDMICRPHNKPTVGQDLEAMVCWMTDKPLQVGDFLMLKHTTRWVKCVVRDLHYRLDVNTLHRDEAVTSLTLNEVGRVALRVTQPLFYDPYRRNRSTGSFILADEGSNVTAGAGMLLRPDNWFASVPGATDITWHEGAVSRADREVISGGRGATLWFTGLSGSGKSTVATAVEQAIVASGRAAYRLDGDNLRTGINADLGFSREERLENCRRVAEVTRLFADAGTVAIVAVISPYAESRELARRLHVEAGLPFVEVFMATPAEECAVRDPKGLYAKASAGTIGSFTGIDDPYEVPEAPDLAIEPTVSVEEAVGLVLAALEDVDTPG